MYNRKPLVLLETTLPLTMKFWCEQVFDLTTLRTASPNTLFSETSHYNLFGTVTTIDTVLILILTACAEKAHNIFINEDTAVAYVVGATTGSQTCNGGLHMIDLTVPASPQFLGCFSEDNYTHDVQCKCLLLPALVWVKILMPSSTLSLY